MLQLHHLPTRGQHHLSAQVDNSLPEGKLLTGLSLSCVWLYFDTSWTCLSDYPSVNIYMEISDSGFVSAD